MTLGYSAAWLISLSVCIIPITVVSGDSKMNWYSFFTSVARKTENIMDWGDNETFEMRVCVLNTLESYQEKKNLKRGAGPWQGLFKKLAVINPSRNHPCLTPNRWEQHMSIMLTGGWIVAIATIAYWFWRGRVRDSANRLGWISQEGSAMRILANEGGIQEEVVYSNTYWSAK